MRISLALVFGVRCGKANLAVEVDAEVRR